MVRLGRPKLDPKCAVVLVVLWIFLFGTSLAYDRRGMEPFEASLCTGKDGQYPPQAYSIWSSWGCYIYLNPDLIKPGAHLNASLCKIPIPTPTRNYSYVPCYKTPDGKESVLFNWKDPKMLELVSSSLRKYDKGKKWLQCSQAADECCSAMLDVARDAGRCPPQWDGWYCWINGGTPGSEEKGFCPDYIYSGSPPSCKHYQIKECFANGTWKYLTDYSTCSVTPQISSRSVYHIVVLAISLVSTIPALIIFFSYRKLRVLRVILHRSLIMAIAARNTLTILSTSTVILPELYATSHGVMEENGVPCRVLATVERLAANAVFACMLLEGFHLHRLIAAAFSTKSFAIPSTIGAAVVTLVPAIAWAIVMATLHDSDCWYVDADGTGYQWINDGPRIVMLLINTILLVNIARVMILKLRSVNSANMGKVRRTAKATLFLMPLFGVQLLLTVVRPNTDDCVVEQVYYFIAYTADGLQGFFVVLIYCFINKEVRELVGRSWKVWLDKFRIRGILKPSNLTSRRGTLLTTLPAPKSTASEASMTRNSVTPHGSQHLAVLQQGSDTSRSTELISESRA